MMIPLPYCVYVLLSRKDRLLYIGYTTDIGKRIQHHNAGMTRSTARRRPLELIFCEFYRFEGDARNREVYFKTTAGKRSIKLMLHQTLLQLGYNRRTVIPVIFEGDSDAHPNIDGRLQRSNVTELRKTDEWSEKIRSIEL